MQMKSRPRPPRTCCGCDTCKCSCHRELTPEEKRREFWLVVLGIGTFLFVVAAAIGIGEYERRHNPKPPNQCEVPHRRIP